MEKGRDVVQIEGMRPLEYDELYLISGGYGGGGAGAWYSQAVNAAVNTPPKNTFTGGGFW